MKTILKFLIERLNTQNQKDLLIMLLKNEAGHLLIDKIFEAAKQKAKQLETKTDDIIIDNVCEILHKFLDEGYKQ